MDDHAVLQVALTASGFDVVGIFEAAQTPVVKERLLANTQTSVDRGTSGSSTFFVGDAIFFGKDRLADVERTILERGPETSR